MTDRLLHTKTEAPGGTEAFHEDRATCQGMSGDSLLRHKGDIHDGLEVIETERGTVAPGAGLILERSRKVVGKNGPSSLTFCEIVAEMFLHRKMVPGRLDEWPVAITDVDGAADRLLAFDSQAAAVGIGGAIGAIGTACAVGIIDGVWRKRRTVATVGVAG